VWEVGEGKGPVSVLPENRGNGPFRQFFKKQKKGERLDVYLMKETDKRISCSGRASDEKKLGTTKKKKTTSCACVQNSTEQNPLQQSRPEKTWKVRRSLGARDLGHQWVRLPAPGAG